MKNKVFAMIIGTVIALAAVSVIIDASSGTASAASPHAPTDLEVDLGDKEITLKWNAPEFDGGDPITHYVIYKDDEIVTEPAGDDDEAVAKRVYTTSFTFMDLTIGEEYRFKVAAVNSAGEGVESGEVTATPATKPGAPTDLQVECGEGGKSVRLEWIAPEENGGSDIIGYNVYKDGKLLEDLSVVIDGDTATATSESLTLGWPPTL